MEYSSPVNNQKNKQLIFKNDDDVQIYAEKNDYIMLLWEEKVIDVTQFANNHPGGIGILEDYNGYDISEIFFSRQIHHHSKYAEQILMQYVVGLVDEDQYNQVQNLKKTIELEQQSTLNEDIFLKFKSLMTQCFTPFKNIFVKRIHKKI